MERLVQHVDDDPTMGEIISSLIQLIVARASKIWRQEQRAAVSTAGNRR